MLELLTSSEMAEADRLAIAAGTTGVVLMENAGRAVAERAATLPGQRVVVVVGPGNNGGDGFVAARCLAERGYSVTVALVGGRERLKGDAAQAAARWQGPVEVSSPVSLAGADIVIDALFGAGLDRPIEGAALAMVKAMNEGGAPIVAVDLPSGVNGTTGAITSVAVRANQTVTFFRRKLGHLLLPGRLHCGTIHVADIGIPSSVLDSVRPASFANLPGLWGGSFPTPRAEGHKYSRGHAIVVSGGLSTTGAARLAARGALRAGAGLVTVASPREALAVNAATNAAVMVRSVDGGRELQAFLEDERRNAVVVGPGGGVGAPMRELVSAVFGGRTAAVLDADALTSFAEQPQVLFDLIHQRGRAGVVLTPHAGEFSKLFKVISENRDIPDKVGRARAASRMSGAIVLLKGPDTVVAAPDGRAAIANNAPPYLATAGSGDVLSGIIAGLLAQGMPAFEAAAAAVWLHGEAANQFGPGLIAEDLPEMLPGVLRRLLDDPAIAR